MGWSVLVEMTLEHGYYAPAMPPVTVWPEDPRGFARDGLLLRQSGARVFVLAEDAADDLPAEVCVDLAVQNPDVITLTRGGDWHAVPRVALEAGEETAGLDADTPRAGPQRPGALLLARVAVTLDSPAKRMVTVRFDAMASHWAYHVIGPGNQDVMIEDTEGEVLFDTIGTVDLPDGRPARVIRSRAALPARARPVQRFSLSRPGPFGPRTLIPVLPAPKPLFAEVPAPDGAGAIIQSDIYVSIF